MAKSSKKEQQKEADNELLIQRAFLAVFCILGAMAIIMVVVTFARYEEERTSPANIYGEWIEMNAPRYARDRFVVREEGIYVEERIVDTDYVFNGQSLIYTYNGKEYKFVMKDESGTVMQRIAPLHYESLFYLVGKYQPKEPEEETIKQPIR